MKSMTQRFFSILFCFFGILLSSAVFANTTVNDLKELIAQIEHMDSLVDRDEKRKQIIQAENTLKQLTKYGYSNKTNEELAAKAYVLIADGYASQHSHLEAIQNYNYAENIFYSLENHAQLAQCLKQKATILAAIGYNIKALESHYNAKLIFEELKDTVQIAQTYLNIARIFKNQKDFQQTKENLDKALNYIQRIDELSLLAKVKKMYAEVTSETGETTKAIHLYQEALSLAKITKDEKTINEILNEIGVLYFREENYDLSKQFLNDALAMSEEKANKKEEITATINLGTLYLKKDKLNKAAMYAHRAEKLFKNSKEDDLKIKGYTLLMRLFEQQKDWKSALKYQKLLSQLREKKERRLIEQNIKQENLKLNIEKNILLTNQLEIEKSLRDKQKTQNRNILFIAVGTTIVLLFSFVLVFYLRWKDVQEKNKIILKQSEERKLLLQEVHHRVKNNFQIVSSMLRLQSYNFDNEELRESFAEAVNRINSMAIVHEVIYKQEKFNDISAQIYLKKLIEVLEQSGDKPVQFEGYSQDVSFRIETLISIGIALNELITNSYKHAFPPAIKNPKIKISLKELEQNKYQLTYQDNGIGIDLSNYQPNFGMELIETIFGNFNGEMEIKSDNLLWPTTITIDFNE